MGPKRRGRVKTGAKAASTRPPAPFKPTAGAATLPPYNSPSVQKLAFHKLVMHLISRPTIASLLSYTANCFNYRDEFRKFLDFVENCEEPMKSELAKVIFPVFVHFYFFMIIDLEVPEADAFYNDFVHVFKKAGYKDVLKELFKIKSKESIEGHPYFKNFRARKYILKLPIVVLKKLNSFLKEIKSIALWQTLSLCFYYEDPEIENLATEKTKKFLHPYKVHKVNLENYYLSKALQESKLQAENQTRRDRSSNLDGKISLVESFAEEPPILETVITWFESDVYAMDFNNDETELCVSYGEKWIFISPLKRSFPISSDESENEEEIDIDESSDDKEESESEDVETPIKMLFPENVRALKYFPTHSNLLLAASNTEVTEVNTKTQTMAPYGPIHISEIWDLDINPIGSFFCSASRDMTCRLWNFEKSTIVRVYSGHEHTVTAIRFHPNEIYLVSGSKDHTVRVWDIENTMSVRCLDEHNAPITLLECCPNKKMIASADTVGVVKIWDIQDNKPLYDLQCFAKGVPDKSRITSLCFGDNNFLAMCNNQGVTRIWDIRQPKAVYTKFYVDIPICLKMSYHGIWNVILRER